MQFDPNFEIVTITTNFCFIGNLGFIASKLKTFQYRGRLFLWVFAVVLEQLLEQLKKLRGKDAHYWKVFILSRDSTISNCKPYDCEQVCYDSMYFCVLEKLKMGRNWNGSYILDVQKRAKMHLCAGLLCIGLLDTKQARDIKTLSYFPNWRML